jgi:hypothetical protein
MAAVAGHLWSGAGMLRRFNSAKLTVSELGERSTHEPLQFLGPVEHDDELSQLIAARFLVFFHQQEALAVA